MSQNACNFEITIHQELKNINNALKDNTLLQIAERNQNIPLDTFKQITSGKSETAILNLIDVKRNKIDDLIGHNKETREAFKTIREALKQDIENGFNKVNPELTTQWKEAEKIYAEMATRESMNKQLGLKDFLQSEISFDSKKIAENYKNIRNSLTDSKEFIRNLGGKKNVEYMDDIMRVAESLPNSKVSNLAYNMKIMAAIGTALAILSGGKSAVIAAATGLSVDAIVKKYLMNQKAMEKIAQYARKQNPENAKIAKNTIKKEFNMSIDDLNKKLTLWLNKLSDSDKAKIGISAMHLTKDDEN